MARVERSITVNAPVEKVFAYLDDPMTQLAWLPGMVEVKDVTGKGVGSHFQWTYKMVGVHFRGRGTVIEHVSDERIVVESKGGIVSTWTWTFEPHDGGTKLNLDIEYTVPVPVLGKLAEALVLKQNEREADLAMANIKAKMEG
jgi:carbon monoxide dehydrogenase subunit G